MAKSKLSAKKTAAPPAAPRKRRTALLSRESKHQALDRATGKIRSLTRSTAVNVWRLGRVLSEVASLKLYTGRGFTTLDAYLEGEAKLSLTFAYQAMRVSQVFTEEVVAVFGAEKLDQGLRYIAATPEPETPADGPRMTMRVRGEGGVREVPFERATIRELRESTHAKATAAKKKRPEGPHRRGARRPAHTLEQGARREPSDEPTPRAPRWCSSATLAGHWWPSRASPSPGRRRRCRGDERERELRTSEVAAGLGDTGAFRGGRRPR
jgi:hypothetical protein